MNLLWVNLAIDIHASACVGGVHGPVTEGDRWFDGSDALIERRP